MKQRSPDPVDSATKNEVYLWDKPKVPSRAFWEEVSHTKQGLGVGRGQKQGLKSVLYFVKSQLLVALCGVQYSSEDSKTVQTGVNAMIAKIWCCRLIRCDLEGEAERDKAFTSIQNKISSKPHWWVVSYIKCQIPLFPTPTFFPSQYAVLSCGPLISGILSDTILLCLTVDLV